MAQDVIYPGEGSVCALWQCAHPQPLSPLQGRLAPRSEGKARAELRHQSGLPHSRSLLLPGRER